MRYFTWKLELVSNILWMVVGPYWLYFLSDHFWLADSMLFQVTLSRNYDYFWMFYFCKKKHSFPFFIDDQTIVDFYKRSGCKHSFRLLNFSLNRSSSSEILSSALTLLIHLIIPASLLSGLITSSTLKVTSEFFYLKRKRCFVFNISQFLWLCEIHKSQNLGCHHRYCFMIEVTLMVISLES